MEPKTQRACSAKWDKFRACKMLGIPYRIVDMTKEIGGFSELRQRFIKINKLQENEDRVWIHELAHTLLHFQHIEGAAGRDQVLNAIAEIEADTVAYITCRILGCADRADYLNYMRVFFSRIPAHKQFKPRMPKLLETVYLILKSGGYYGTN